MGNNPCQSMCDNVPESFRNKFSEQSLSPAIEGELVHFKSEHKGEKEKEEDEDERDVLKVN